MKRIALPCCIKAGGGDRNSSIELLRIIAMFMILAHHFVVHNGFDVASLPVGQTRFILEVFFEGSGKIGVVIFFSISAWYLLDREQTLKSALKKIWVMESQLLFYGIALCAFMHVAEVGSFEGKDLPRSFLPLVFQCWWYMSAYAGFLILLPFLRKGLLALGREAHRTLCIAIVLIWGVLPMIPWLGMGIDNVFGFCCMACLMAYLKWRLPGAIKPKYLIAFGYGIIFSGWIFEIVIQLLLGKTMGLWLARSTGLAAISAGFGLFLLFERVEMSSALINRLAACSTAVYLITDYVPMRSVLWNGLFDINGLMVGPLPLLKATFALFALYVVCAAIELIRQLAFSGLSRHEKGYWFERLYAHVEPLASAWIRKY